MSHCIECGAEVEEDDKFCPECGATVVKKGKAEKTEQEKPKTTEETKPGAEEKKEKHEPKTVKKKPEGEGSGVRKLILGLALVFLMMSLTFFVVVVPRAAKRPFFTPAPAVSQRVEDKLCDIGGDMGCLDVIIHQNAVEFTFQNPLRKEIVITAVSVGGCKDAEPNMLVRPGEKGALVVKDCSLGGLGQYVEAKVTAHYNAGDEQRRAFGTIAGIVQSNLRTAAAVEDVKAEKVVMISR